ncbi:MAG: hypothetical protein ACOCR1_02250, partial [Planctomycetota bacterium]
MSEDSDRSARDEIIEWLAEATPLDRPQLDDLLEVPPDPEMGAYALPCFALAGELGKPPADIASGLAEVFDSAGMVTEAIPSGPYLNFTVDRA